MREKEVHVFEKVQSQLEGILTEITILAKKSPNDGVNKFKLKFINELLVRGNEILGKTYKPLESFEQFDEEEMPSNSDVTFILSQYLNCFEKMRSDNIHQSSHRAYGKAIYEWFWILDKSEVKIKTSPPNKIK